MLAREQRRQMGDVGVVAQRYQLVLFGNAQKLELQSWQPETARTVHQNFAWKPATWYRLKLRVDKDGSSVRARGKAWLASDPEPEAWMLERVDPHPQPAWQPGPVRGRHGRGLDRQRDGHRERRRDAPRRRPRPGPRPERAALFEYDRGARPRRPGDGRRPRGTASGPRHQLCGTDGGRTAAYVVAPEGKGQSRPAVLFVHWFEPQEKDSNRTQFLRAGLGAGPARRGVAAGRHHVVRPRVVPRARLREGLRPLGRAGAGAAARARRAARASRRRPVRASRTSGTTSGPCTAPSWPASTRA